MAEPITVALLAAIVGGLAMQTHQERRERKQQQQQKEQKQHQRSSHHQTLTSRPRTKHVRIDTSPPNIKRYHPATLTSTHYSHKQTQARYPDRTTQEYWATQDLWPQLHIHQVGAPPCNDYCLWASTHRDQRIRDWAECRALGVAVPEYEQRRLREPEVEAQRYFYTPPSQSQSPKPVWDAGQRWETGKVIYETGKLKPKQMQKQGGYVPGNKAPLRGPPMGAFPARKYSYVRTRG